MYTLEINETRIPVKRLITDFQDRERFLDFCKECHNYNKRWSCPSLSFDENDFLLNYKNAHLISTRVIFNKEVRESIRGEDINKVSNDTIKEVRNMLSDALLSLEGTYPSSISIVSGGCNICKECTRTYNKPCFYPEKMRYSLNTFGFDISKLLTELFHIELKWGKDMLPEYYTLVSAFLTNEDLPLNLMKSKNLKTITFS